MCVYIYMNVYEDTYKNKSKPQTVLTRVLNSNKISRKESFEIKMLGKLEKKNNTVNG